MSRILFSETHYFRQWWLLGLVLGLNGFILFGLVSQVFLGQVFGDKPMSNTGLVFVAILQTAFTLFILLQRLSVKIDEEGVHLRFWPYHMQWKLYRWENISSCEVKKYNPVSEYGGWGLCAGAYNVSGNMGLLLTFNDGRFSQMIGTKEPEKIKLVLEKLGKI